MTGEPVLIETIVLVDLLRGAPRARSFISSLALERRFVSAVSVAELVAGFGYLDSLIGAAASCLGIGLATLNEKHFKAFPGLKVTRPY